MAGQIGVEMPGIGGGDEAIGVDAEDGGGREPSAAATEAAVKVREQFGGRLGEVDEGAEGANDDGDFRAGLISPQNASTG